MRLDRFEATDFRNLESIGFEPHSGLNVCAGKNGSGKSSLLEAIEVLATGRSFRSRRSVEHIRFGAEFYSVRAEWTDEASGVAHRAGLRRDRSGGVDLRLDYVRQASFLDVSQQLPVKAIVPSSGDLVSGSRSERRRFLDWGVFHVEPSFAACWQRFRRALAQRNALLRSGARDPAAYAPWDAELSENGTVLHELRSTYVLTLSDDLATLLDELRTDFDVRIEYVRGWRRDIPLHEALDRQFEHCLRQRTTSIGPQRAELMLSSAGTDARYVLSRGQSKVLTYLLHLAQLALLQRTTGQRAVLLCDDPASELDGFHVEQLLNLVRKLGLQTFATTTRFDALAPWADRRLDMQRGTLTLAL